MGLSKSPVFATNLFLITSHSGEISLGMVLFETIPHNFSSGPRSFFKLGNNEVMIKSNLLVSSGYKNAKNRNNGLIFGFLIMI